MNYNRVNTSKGRCLENGRNISILVMNRGEGDTDDLRERGTAAEAICLDG